MANKKSENTEKNEKINESATIIANDQFAEIEMLKAQLEQMTKLMATMMGQNSSVANSQIRKVSSLDEEVKIVHLIENPSGITTHVELSNITLDFTTFGEERTLDRRQAEELAGKKRGWFENGILAFGAGNEDMAKRFSLKSVNDYKYINPNFLENIANLNAIELESFYKSLSEGHKSFLIGYFKRKILENKDPRFSDSQKIEMLNRITMEETRDHRGVMENVILDRSQNK